MRKVVSVLLVLAGAFLYSCSNNSGKLVEGNELADNAIMQQQDGTISLEVKMADTYHDIENPESNTAEWNVVVSKSGRYDVWLSSATRDTTNLRYNNSVMLSIKDDLLEAKPSIDKVVQNSVDVSYPYFRADSFMGSLFIKDAGVYNIQVISDKILPGGATNNDPSESEWTKLLSVSLTPADKTRSF